MTFALLDAFLDAGHNGQPEPRLQVMVIILVISLFAVSFPGVSASIPFLRIPHIAFFIGKHFGTGVILATAFIHLLQDSFEALQKPQVKEHFHNIGQHTGLIMYADYLLFSPPGSLLHSLVSLLSIFLIEYVSTSYVEYLQEEPSQPSTPVSSHPLSPQRSRSSTLKTSPPAPTSFILAAPETSQRLDSSLQKTHVHHVQPSRTDETTPLLRPPRTQSTPYLSQPHTYTGRHAHHALLPVIATQDITSTVPIEVLTNSPRIIKMRGCTCVADHACNCPPSTSILHPLPGDTVSRKSSRSNHRVLVQPQPSLVEGESLGISAQEGESRQEKPTIGRRRQVIGLLVLQLGIMIHSTVIGLTLAITTGADFMSLTTAVIFHQLFEGLSLGIRIAALPPPSSGSNPDEESETEISNKPEARGYRKFVQSATRAIGGERGDGWLKCSLAVLFAITTPVGLGLGMVVFNVGKQKHGIELARMYLIQGLMSAISAGMLIYVSTVEMIAGDFVFGDVEGHSRGHGHGHSHDLPSARDEEQALPDRTKLSSSCSGSVGQPLPGEENNAEAAEPDDSRFHYHHHHHHHHKIGKKVLAVSSLLAGVGGMVLVGLGE